MEYQFTQLKEATHQRLLAINDDIRRNRKNKKSITTLVQYRKQTNILLNKITLHIQRKNLNEAVYVELKNNFLNPF